MTMSLRKRLLLIKTINQDKSDYFAFPQNDSIFMGLKLFLL